MLADLKPLQSSPSFEVNGVWSVARLWTIARIRSEKNRPDLRLLSVFLGRGVIPYTEGGGQVHKPSLDLAGYQVVYPGDLVLNNQQAWRGSVGVSSHMGIISPAYLVLSLSHMLDPRFANYLFQSRVMVAQFVTASKGVGDIQRDIHTPWLKNARVPVPTLSEQAASVRFLDHADQRIRRHIRAKQKLIALLNEQKQAIIHRAVTRGLIPNVRLKPSGVEWLGEVPEHWEVKRLRNLAAHVTSGSRGWSNYAGDFGPLFIRIGNLTRGSIELDLSDVVRLKLPTSVVGETARTRVAPDDILLSITAFIGSVAVVPADLGEAYVSQHVACCRLAPGVANAKWLGYVLLSPIGKTHGMLCMYGGTKQGLSLDDVKNHVVLLPPRDEQDLLVQRIEAEAASIDKAMRAARREISLLREYRTCLIADVVTGKLDVRAAAARLPDEADGSEPLDHAEDVVEGDEETEDANLDAVTEEAEA